MGIQADQTILGKNYKIEKFMLLPATSVIFKRREITKLKPLNECIFPYPEQQFDFYFQFIFRLKYALYNI